LWNCFKFSLERKLYLKIHWQTSFAVHLCTDRFLNYLPFIMMFSSYISIDVDAGKLKYYCAWLWFLNVFNGTIQNLFLFSQLFLLSKSPYNFEWKYCHHFDIALRDYSSEPNKSAKSHSNNFLPYEKPIWKKTIRLLFLIILSMKYIILNNMCRYEHQFKYLMHFYICIVNFIAISYLFKYVILHSTNNF